MKTAALLIVLSLVTTAYAATAVTVEGARELQLPNGQTRKMIKEVTPEYPAYLRAKRIAGIVVVRLWVQPNGTVARTEVRYSTHPELTRLASAAVIKWRFEAAPKGDERVLMLEIPITFRLRDVKKK